MALDNVVRFVEAATGDGALEEDVRALAESGNSRGIVRLAAEAGFDFTEDELRESIRAALRLASEGEMSHEDLNQVSGGNTAALYNLMSQIIKTMNERRSHVIKNML